MKSRRIIGVFVALIITLNLLSCSNNTIGNDVSTLENDIFAPQSQSTGQIYLYGEAHGVKKILDKEFELWYEYYHNQNMRHLFVELPYYTAEFLNLWMQSDSNEILDELYSDWDGSALGDTNVKKFYEKIKNQCPETIFHGTDVGHQYLSIGIRFRNYLEENNMKESEMYLLTEEAIKQGKYFHSTLDRAYRENMMVKNFIREFDNLKGESIMGIYGAAHTGLEAMNFTNIVPCMTNQLHEHYGDIIHSEDLSSLANEIEPYRVDIIKLGGKDYEALYFGKQDMTWSQGYAYKEFWRLENAYDDFKDCPKNGNVIPYSNYPMLIETGQVFVIDYTKTDGSVMRMYFRSDGRVLNNKPSTEEFTVE